MIDIDTVVRHRQLRGLSQRTLAARIGVDPLTVHRLERGHDPGDLPLRVVARLAKELRLPLGDLLTSGTDPCADRDAGPAPMLPHDQARLLHRIHTTGQVPRSLSAIHRTITLPALINNGLIQVSDGTTHIHPDVSYSLNP